MFTNLLILVLAIVAGIYIQHRHPSAYPQCERLRLGITHFITTKIQLLYGRTKTNQSKEN